MSLKAKDREHIVAGLAAALMWRCPLSVQVVPPKRLAILDHDSNIVCHIEGDIYATQPFAHQAITWINAVDEIDHGVHAKVVRHVMECLLHDRAISHSLRDYHKKRGKKMQPRRKKA